MSASSNASSTMSMPTMGNNIRMPCLPIIFNLHDCTTIVAISMVDHMLYPTIRKSNSVLSLNVTSLITRPHFTKVCVILVIMHSILEVEGVRCFIINLSVATTSNQSSTSMATFTSMASSTNQSSTSNTSSNPGRTS